MAVKFVDITRKKFLKEHPRLYRFITVERVLAQLRSKELNFINPTKWSDPFEKFFLERDYLIGSRKVFLPIRNRAFCLCLSGTLSSEAYWRVYAPKENGMRTTIKTEKLLDLLNDQKGYDFHVGKVKYQITKEFHAIKLDKPALIDEINRNQVGPHQLRLLLKKRKSFLYEDEVRIMGIVTKAKNTIVLNVPIDLKIVTSEFLLDPRMEKNQVKMIKEYFLKNYGIKVWHSTLYKDIPRKSISLN
ncbi:MAG: DUF2971 domain-containing protein [Cyclobacteriaceae bacterium]